YYPFSLEFLIMNTKLSVSADVSGELKMKELTNYLQKQEDVASILEALASGAKEQSISGLAGPARSMFTSAVHHAEKRKKIIITHQLLHAQSLYDDMIEFTENPRVYLYPVNELIAAEMAVQSPEMRATRIQSLINWLKSEDGTLIVPVAALKRLLPPKHYWDSYQFTLTDGESISIEEHLELLVEMGYERVDMVTSPAEFSVRGGIIDIYPSTVDYPIRLDMFDYEIDSMSYFDADSKRSLGKHSEITIGPAKKILLTKEDSLKAAERLEKELADALKRMKNSDAKETLLEEVEADIEKLKNHETFQDMYKYGALFYEQQTSLLDYASKDAVLLLDEMGRIQETAQNLDAEESELSQSLMEQHTLLPGLSFSFDWNTVKMKMTQQRIYMSLFLRHVSGTHSTRDVNISSRAMQEFHGQMPLFQHELERWKKAAFSVLITANDDARAEKVQA